MGPPNCFCAASVIIPGRVSPSADLIHLSYLVGGGPLAQHFSPSLVRCSRQRLFNPIRKFNQCCFSESGQHHCVPVNSFQNCLTSMLSLSTQICPPNPTRGAFSGQGFNGGFQGGAGHGGFGGFPGGAGGEHGGFPGQNGGFNNDFQNGFQPGFNGGFHGGSGLTPSPSPSPAADDRR